MIHEDGCPCTGDEPFVFVSYAHKSKKEVMPVIQWLNDNNYHIWYDNGIHSGEFASIIAEKLEKATCIIAFLSDEYIESINCRNEINYAIKKNKVILPICMKPTTLRNGMELQLVSYHFIYRYQLDEATFYEHLRQSPEIQTAQRKSSSNSFNYTAFISFRHCPLDIRIAKELQKSIETFAIPKALRVEGKKKLGPVFLDWTTIPPMNHLAESICAALEHSQYLIVKCTPETPKSQLIESEIQYFIEKHGRERILPVLAAGTPEESIPESIMDTEPLFIDLTDEDEKKVLNNLKKEFLRIAVVLLGCRYGDLVQRRRLFGGLK